MPKNKYIQEIINKFFIPCCKKDLFSLFYDIFFALNEKLCVGHGKKRKFYFQCCMSTIALKAINLIFFPLYIIEILHTYLLKKPIFGPRETAFFAHYMQNYFLNHATKYGVRVLQTICTQSQNQYLSLLFKKIAITFVIIII